MSGENHIIKVSFCGKFQKAVKPKRSNFSNYYVFHRPRNTVFH